MIIVMVMVSVVWWWWDDSIKVDGEGYDNNKDIERFLFWFMIML